MSTLQQHWQHHIDAWQQTQLSQAQYCRSHQLDQSQFSYWKRKILGAPNTSTVSSQFTIAQVETQHTTSTLRDPHIFSTELCRTYRFEPSYD
ncbi:IS66 family insertion sequence element accessory protein TnpA [Vibrio breoganii]|uniref:IS66 family insertion sequence element accessory protein TnpA n=1 Tax=Vibrio breoganii TaxID=553239 RepID=UPI001F535B80|nr:hypothetical protein [Vibrio breoganii]